MKCSKCGSDNLIRHGWQWRLDKDEPYKVQRYRCNDCGRFTLHSGNNVGDKKDATEAKERCERNEKSI